MIRQNLVDVDEVSLSVASHISNGNIESMIGINNLLNCFDGDYGDVVDDGDDDTSKLIFFNEQLVFPHELHSNAKFKDFIVHCSF